MSHLLINKAISRKSIEYALNFSPYCDYPFSLFLENGTTNKWSRETNQHPLFVQIIEFSALILVFFARKNNCWNAKRHKRRFRHCADL